MKVFRWMPIKRWAGHHESHSKCVSKGGQICRENAKTMAGVKTRALRPPVCNPGSSQHTSDNWYWLQKHIGNSILYIDDGTASVHSVSNDKNVQTKCGHLMTKDKGVWPTTASRTDKTKSKW